MSRLSQSLIYSSLILSNTAYLSAGLAQSKQAPKNSHALQLQNRRATQHSEALIELIASQIRILIKLSPKTSLEGDLIMALAQLLEPNQPELAYMSENCLIKICLAASAENLWMNFTQLPLDILCLSKIALEDTSSLAALALTIDGLLRCTYPQDRKRYLPDILDVLHTF